MDRIQLKQLHAFYRENLLEDCIPFWLKNSIDRKHGGYLTCLDREGNIYNTDKSVWFQGRGVWLYSRLYNTVQKKQAWLEAAESGYHFLVNHCFDSDGRMFFQVTDDGRPLRKRRYMYSEAFAVIACAEYAKASGNPDALKKAREIYDVMLHIYKSPVDADPKVFPETRVTKSLAVPMILLATTQSLRESDHDPVYDGITSELTETIFSDFLKPNEKALFESVGANGERLDSPQGRCINPGHSIETACFLMQEGLFRNDRSTIDKALNILDWSLEIGWDKEYGGLLYFVDLEGKPPEQLEWDMKLWWPHTEALYALLLAYSITADPEYETWYCKMHDWTFSHFPDKEYGEWFGYLHRDGTVANTLKGSLWKGPFHLPRALMQCLKLTEEMLGKETDGSSIF